MLEVGARRWPERYFAPMSAVGRKATSLACAVRTIQVAQHLPCALRSLRLLGTLRRTRSASDPKRTIFPLEDVG